MGNPCRQHDSDAAPDSSPLHPAIVPSTSSTRSPCCDGAAPAGPPPGEGGGRGGGGRPPRGLRLQPVMVVVGREGNHDLSDPSGWEVFETEGGVGWDRPSGPSSPSPSPRSLPPPVVPGLLRRHPPRLRQLHPHRRPGPHPPLRCPPALFSPLWCCAPKELGSPSSTKQCPEAPTPKTVWKKRCSKEWS